MTKRKERPEVGQLWFCQFKPYHTVPLMKIMEMTGKTVVMLRHDNNASWSDIHRYRTSEVVFLERLR